MLQYRKILELNEQGFSMRSIAANTGNSRPKVSEIIKKAMEKGIKEPFTEEMTDSWFEGLLFPEKMRESKGRELPDFEYIYKELAKPNVTLSLLHHEYELECRNSDKIPYAYRTYCQYYTEYARKYKATMRIKRKPGEIMEVDWAGATLKLVDRDTGNQVKAYLFVATLPCTQYTYCEATLSMKQDDWINVHIRAYNYFGGVTELLVPDNLKTGVSKTEYGAAILNEVYRELADHYGTVILPARIRTPKDKASVEGNVGNLSTWVIASLRNSVYFTLDELNADIKKKLDEFNDRPFTKKYKLGNRTTAFEEEEKFALKPLPLTPFRLATWKTATVQLDYMVSIESMFYSVPYEYIQNKVDIRLTKDLVEVFYKDSRIATHKRLYGKFGQFSTNRDHMPDNHKLYIDHTKESVIDWANTIGEATTKVVTFIFDYAQAERQALKATMRLKNQGKKYSKEELETACEAVLKLASTPTVRTVETLLASNKKKNAKMKLNGDIPEETTKDYGFTRGASYFGGKLNDE
ncbi:hypothetical protein IGI37_002893 [Enterococcus sp. AZ194]|uniref:IS21 family transposase n=1 Tax=Enterococcus sp. AZ194 TaxID=2774629 RepID=UPI003F283167